MAISRSQLIQKVRNRLGEPMVKVEMCDDQISEHIDYARQKWIKWAIGNATQEAYFTIMLQGGKTLYDLPAGVCEVIEYDDHAIRSGGINTLFTIENYMFGQGMFGNMISGGPDLVSYHIALDFLKTLEKYTPSRYNWKYHRSTNQLEINPAPPLNESMVYRWGNDDDTGLPKEYVFDSPGYVLLRSYVLQGSTLPTYKPEWKDVLKEVKTVVEDVTITTNNILNKSLVLKHTPCIDYSDKFDTNVQSDIKLTVNGITTTKFVDFDQLYTNRRVLTWSELGLDGQLVIGDEVSISYPVLFESEYYPDEWTNVTSTSKEVEQYRINQNHIDTGKVTLSWPVWDDNVTVSAGGIVHNFGEDFKMETNDKKILTWKDLGLDGVLGIGDEIIITYVAVRSRRPNNSKANKSVTRQYTTRIENRKLTQEEIDNKSLETEDPVSVGDGMKITVGAFDRVYGIDFRLEDSTIVSWDGLALDGVDGSGNLILNVGDDIVVSYTSATPFEKDVEEAMYDEDWILDYVTAMSKMSLGLIRRKFANFSSLGNQGISLDGSDLISEGQSEKEYLEQTLRDEEAYEGYGVSIGMM